MVDNLNLSTLISQIPEAQKIHQPQLAQAEAQQAMAREMVMRRQKQEQEQVAKTDASTTDTEVDPDGHHGAAQEYANGRTGSHPAAQPEPESDQGRLIDNAGLDEPGALLLDSRGLHGRRDTAHGAGHCILPKAQKIGTPGTAPSRPSSRNSCRSSTSMPAWKRRSWRASPSARRNWHCWRTS